MRVRYLLALLSIWFAMPAMAEVEARCTELGANCIRSETLNATNDPANGWNPDNSSGAQACTSVLDTGVADGPLTLQSSGMVGSAYAPGASAFNVFQCFHPGPSEVMFGNGDCALNPTSSDHRACIRWYKRVNPFTHGTANNCTVLHRHKIMDADLTGTSGGDYQVEEQTSNETPCPNPGPYHNWQLTSRGGPVEDVQPMSPAITWEDCMWDGSGNNGWCRFEFCVHGDIGEAGDAYGQMTVTEVDTGIVHTSPDLIRTHTDPVGFDIIRPNNDMDGASASDGTLGGYQISYFMSAKWATDAGQMIGPASEIEAVGGPVPPNAKSIIITGGSIR